MNNFCTFFRNLSKSDKIAKKDLKDISNLAKAVVKDDLGDYAKFLVCNWHEDNDPWIDFNFALRPDWVVGTPDDKQIKMRVSIDQSDNSWYVYRIVDCQDGECEEWGEKEFKPEELESCTECVRYMLGEINKQYERKLQEENAKSDADLDKATQVAKQLQKHVDAIKKLCKENKLNIYSDHSIDGTSCLYLVPDGMRCLDDDDSGEVIDLEKIPYLDFDAMGFDPNYDFFHRVK